MEKTTSWCVEIRHGRFPDRGWIALHGKWLLKGEVRSLVDITRDEAIEYCSSLHRHGMHSFRVRRYR